MAARPPVAPPTLLCKECKFENEPERVYCHNCGAKLDRSLLPPEVVQTRRDPAETQREVQKLMKPSSARLGRVVRNLLFCLVFGALVAAGFEASREPQDVPDLKQEQIDNARQIDAELQALVDARAVRSIAYSENDVNAYLKNNVRPKKNQPTIYGLKFEGAYAQFLDGNVCGMTQRMSLYDYPLYFTVAHRVAVQGGKLMAVPVGARLGRLPLPAVVVKPLNELFAPSWAAEKSDKKMVEQLGSIAFRKGQVQLTTSGL
jgi:hypothetical protein